MSKKNYVYKVVCNGKVYADLDSAVTAVTRSLHNAADNSVYSRGERVSKSHVFKQDGGYVVMLVTMDGSIFKRRIDVFEPTAYTKKGKRSYVLDQVSHKNDWDR